MRIDEVEGFFSTTTFKLRTYYTEVLQTSPAISSNTESVKYVLRGISFLPSTLNSGINFLITDYFTDTLCLYSDRSAIALS